MTKTHTELFLGWDVGGTKSAAVVATLEGEVLDRQQWPSHAKRGPDAMLADFLAHAHDLKKNHPAICQVGVSIGGPLNAGQGVILSPPHLPGWDALPLAQQLEQKLNLPVVVEHDAAACLLAEWIWGAAHDTTHSAYLTCGTGCGAGIMIGGRILRGPKGQTPEVGHVRMADDGPEAFGKCGSVESFSSGTGIAKLAHFLFPDTFPKPTSTKKLSEMAADGHTLAQQVLNHAAQRTGQLCAMLTDIFSPQVIILGSLARYLGDDWLEEVRTHFKAEALEINAAEVRIVAPHLGDRLQDLSAIAPCVYKRLHGA